MGILRAFVFVVILLLPVLFLLLRKPAPARSKGFAAIRRGCHAGSKRDYSPSRTGIERILKTDEAGRLAAPFMPVGTYSVSPELPGMVAVARTEVVWLYDLIPLPLCDLIARRASGFAQESRRHKFRPDP